MKIIALLIEFYAAVMFWTKFFKERSLIPGVFASLCSLLFFANIATCCEKKTSEECWSECCEEV